VFADPADSRFGRVAQPTTAEWSQRSGFSAEA
jgi:hypothetical protein